MTKNKKYAVVHGKRGYRRKGYYRKAFVITRNGKRIRIPRSYIRPTHIKATKKRWKMKIWHLK